MKKENLELEKIKNNPKYSSYKEEAKIKINLGEIINEARKRKNISQTELANKAKTTQSVISDIERGDYNPGLVLLFRITKALDIDGIKVCKIFETSVPAQIIPYNSNENDSENREATYNQNNNKKIKS